MSSDKKKETKTYRNQASYALLLCLLSHFFVSSAPFLATSLVAFTLFATFFVALKPYFPSLVPSSPTFYIASLVLSLTFFKKNHTAPRRITLPFLPITL
jgi:hypothetical protein